MAESAPQYCVLPFMADTGLNRHALHRTRQYNTKHQQMMPETLQLVLKTEYYNCGTLLYLQLAAFVES